jgi:hypothetical protein
MRQSMRTGARDRSHLSSLKPPDLAGEELFKHVIGFRKRNVNDEEHEMSAHLNASPKDKLQRQLLERSGHDQICGSIVREVGLDGGTEKTSKRKLDALGCVRSESGFVNSEKRMKRSEEQLRLCQLLEEVKLVEEIALREKKRAEKQEMEETPSGALEKLTKKTVILKRQSKRRFQRSFMCAMTRINRSCELSHQGHSVQPCWRCNADHSC